MTKKRYIPPFLWFFTYAFIAAAGIIWLQNMIDERATDQFLGEPATIPILVGIGIGIVISGLCRFFSKYSESVRKMESEFSLMIGHQSIWDCFFLALMSSIAEEIFFRGALQFKLGIIIASIIFGILHWPLNTNLKLWPLFAFIMGLILGYEYIYFKTILAPIATHFVVNFINLNSISQYYRIHYSKYEGV